MSVAVKILIKQKICSFPISAPQINQAYCTLYEDIQRLCEINNSTFILKLAGYVEMQIFGRLLGAERDPARLGDNGDMIYEPACWLWQALLFYVMIDGSIS